jgi:hypothetical protein
MDSDPKMGATIAAGAPLRAMPQPEQHLHRDLASLVWLILLVSAFLSPAWAACLNRPPGLASWWRAEADGSGGFGANHGSLVNSLGFASGEVGQAFNFTASAYGLSVVAEGWDLDDISVGGNLTVPGRASLETFAPKAVFLCASDCVGNCFHHEDGSLKP